MAELNRAVKTSAELKETVEFASEVLRAQPIGTDGRGRERSYSVGELLDVLVSHWAELPDPVQQLAARTATVVAQRPAPLIRLA